MPMTLNVRLNGILEDHVAENVSGDGAYENVSEYVRDLIRKDRERTEEERFQTLKMQLQAAYVAPEANYRAYTANDIIARAKLRRT